MKDYTVKHLRIIAAAAVILTILMIGYTMGSAINGNRFLNSYSDQQTAGYNPHQNLASDSVPDNLFPVSLAGMERVQSLSGQETIDAVRSMYGTSIKLTTAYAVGYQDPHGGQMIIWFAETQNEKDAAQLFKDINTNMPPKQDFSDYKKVTIDGKQYMSISGMKLQNFYWLTGRRVIWVGFADVKNNEDTLKQFASLY